VPIQEVADAFDQISLVYDATRDPLSPATVDSMAAQLKARGIRTILEVGVGTGRIAQPLAQRGFEVTGVDASRRMLAVARSKGLVRLVQGDALRLPFGDRAFDTTLFVHVLHLLDDAPSALDEGVRVGRLGATGLVHPAWPDHPDPVEGTDRDPRRIVYRYLAREGYPVPDRGGGPRTRERALLARLPPDSLVVVSDREVTEPLARRIDMLERRGSRHTLSVPPDVLQRAAAAARAEVGDRTMTYRRVEALANWSKGPYRTAGPA
jgi:ubiquinone/menaquinone biosynthesis C-methylase UbiE